MPRDNTLLFELLNESEIVSLVIDEEEEDEEENEEVDDEKVEDEKDEEVSVKKALEAAAVLQQFVDRHGDETQ